VEPESAALVSARDILEQVSDAIVVVDESGTIVVFNSAAEDLFGYRAGEVVGRAVECLVPGESTGPHSSLVSGFVRSAGARRLMAPDRGLVSAVRKGGARFPAAITVGPIDLGLGRALAMAAVRDQTAVVEATDRLVAATQQLERRNDELEQFLWSASHDLREPLRKVQAFSAELALALGEDVDEWTGLCIERTTDAARRMAALLDDLIGYGRLSVRSHSVALVVLNDVVGECLDDLSLRIDETGADVVVGELPEIRGDAVLLRQLFQNVIANALKFHEPARAAVVRVSVIPSTDPSMVAVAVDDEGIGIDPQYRDRAFEPFRRLNPPEAFAGTGMGLTIARKVAELHGGMIDVEAGPGGVGTRMVVTFAVDT
jgi:two-component system, LuxR family, sensor kinase FixL